MSLDTTPKARPIIDLSDGDSDDDVDEAEAASETDSSSKSADSASSDGSINESGSNDESGSSGTSKYVVGAFEAVCRRIFCIALCGQVVDAMTVASSSYRMPSFWGCVTD